MAELERAARVHARMLANQPDLTPPQGGPVHPLEDLPAAARWVDVEGQGELRLQGVLRRARHVLRRRLLRLQAGASAAPRRRVSPQSKTTPPPPRPQRWRSRPSTSSRTPRATTPSASSSSTARPATRAPSSASSPSTCANSVRRTPAPRSGCARPRPPTGAARRVSTPGPRPPQPDCRDQRSRQARHHVQRLRGAVPASRHLPKPPPPGALPA